MKEPTTISGVSAAAIGPGTRLNGVFEIDELIAVGGMGHVYRGRALETGDRVAIKMIRPDLAQSDTYLAMFRKEASALHRTPHDAIVRYYIFTTDPDLQCPYLAMEFVEGVSLATLYERRPLDLAAVRILQRRLASGLEMAHQLGVIHRDVTPDNIILPDNDPRRAKLIDFGIARDTFSPGTVIGSGFAGKSNFASPEQIGLYGANVTFKSDIYSLGLTLAAALLGEPIDMAGTPADLVLKRQQLPDLSRIDPEIRPLLEHMLQPNPADRPGSMEEVAAWPHRPIPRTFSPISPSPMATRIAPAPTAPVAIAQPGWRFPAAVAGLFLLAGAIGFAGWWSLARVPQTGSDIVVSTRVPPVKDATPKPADTPPVLVEAPRGPVALPPVQAPPPQSLPPLMPPPPPAPPTVQVEVPPVVPTPVLPPLASTPVAPPVPPAPPIALEAAADTRPASKPEPAPIAPQLGRPYDPAAFRDCASCPELLAVPAGTFMMGGTDVSEKPVHKVNVAAFALGRFPVTVAEWQACVKAKGCSFDPGGTPDAPVHNLSWDDALQYVSWLSKTTGHRYRLPSEAEWEYAARARSVTRYWWGNTFEPGMADCRGCSSLPQRDPSKIALHPANGFRLYDITGTIAQWVEDCWHKDFKNAPGDGAPWLAASCGQRVLRGGSWNSAPNDLRVSSREFYDQNVRYPGHGLRVARDL